MHETFILKLRYFLCPVIVMVNRNADIMIKPQGAYNIAYDVMSILRILSPRQVSIIVSQIEIDWKHLSNAL